MIPRRTASPTRSPKPSTSRFGGPGGGRRDSRPQSGGPGGGPGGDRERGPRFFRKKVCRFCSDRSEIFDFKEPERVARFLTEKGKIVPRRITGNCAKHQRALARTIKRSRHSSLLAFQID